MTSDKLKLEVAMLIHMWRSVLVVVVASAIGVFPMGWSQNVTGTIAGIVRDSSGAAVPNAEVTVVHEATNTRYVGRTDGEGLYSIAALPIGVYRLTVEVSGFKKFEVSRIHLQVNEIARVLATLQVGAVTESVQVEASVVAVDTQTATLKTVVDGRRIEDLPLNGRDPVQLMRLVAGVQLYRGDSVTSDTTYPGVVAVSVNGGRGNTVNYMLDGANNNDHFNNAPSPMPNPDALAEFSVQTSNFSAEFGRNVGGIVNAVTKSGTNQLHGSAFEYLRHHKLNAGSFFAPPRPDDPAKKLDDGLKRNQFGATLGGPIVLPKLYDGRNRSFFFASYQRTRIRQRPSSQFQEVYTAAERQGDFSALLPGTVLRNPSTGGVYPNNRIPQSDFNPVTRAFIDQFIPLPTISPRRIVTTTVVNHNDDQVLVRGDHAFRGSNRLSGRFYDSRASRPGFLNAKNYLERTAPAKWRNTSVAVYDTHTFSPTVINAVTFGFTRTATGLFPVLPKSWSDLGARITQDIYPQIVLGFQGPLSGINTVETESFWRREFQVTNILRWSRSRHQMSLGGEWGYGVGDQGGNFRANAGFTFSHAAGFTGYAPADFLLGKFASFQQNLGTFKDARFKRHGLFFQDSIRATKNLTFDVGLRWEPFFPYTDKRGRLAGFAPGQQSARFVNAPRGILYAGDPGLPGGIYPVGWKNFAPRVGIAYDLTGDGKTSLRAGYGIFYDQPNSISTNTHAQQAPFGPVVIVFGTNANSMSDPYAGHPGGNPFSVVGLAALQKPDVFNFPKESAFPLPLNAVAFALDMRNAYSQAWNFSLERALPLEFVVRASYAGSKGTGLVSARDANAPLPDRTASTATTNQRRPLFPNFGQITLIEPAGNSIFNSLQLGVEKRFSARFSIMSNYMWSKTIDDNVGSSNKGISPSLTDPRNQRFDRGPADFDKVHVFNFSSLWDIPGRLSNPVANAVLGGWSLSKIVALQSGFPFTVVSGSDNARTGQGGQRADMVGNSYFSEDRSKGQRIAEWLRRSAFVQNALGTYGTLGRNTFRGPGRAAVDLGVHKKFTFSERLVAELRFEAFNAFNHANFTNPTASVTSSQFMQITGVSDPRILQVALRLGW